MYKNNKKHKITEINIDAEMSPPISSFTTELVPSEDGARKGDKFFIAKETAATAEVQSGSIGCYMPQGRVGISQRFEALEKALNEQDKRLRMQADSLTFQAEEIQILKAENHRLISMELRNRIVQLFFGIMHAKILETVPNAPKIIGNHPALRFEQVLSNPKIDSSLKNKLLKDQTYIGLKKLMKDGIWSIVEIRNSEVHPYILSLNVIENIIAKVNDGKLLDVDDRKLFKETSKFYQELKKLKDFNLLVDAFNNRINV